MTRRARIAGAWRHWYSLLTTEHRRERLWQVLQLDMAEWPTEEMPEEVAVVLQRRFQHLRERDGVE